MSGYDKNERMNSEVKRIQEQQDKLALIPDELADALIKASSFASHRVDAVLSMLSAGKTHEEIVASETAYFDARGQAYDFDSNVVSWLGCSPFLAEFTRWIRKRSADKFGSQKNHTAAAIFNMKTEEVEIVYNPRFMANLSDEKSKTGQVDPFGAAINEHEHQHLIFQHVTSRRRDPAGLDNIAKDLANNSLIARCDTPSRLPPNCLLPGVHSRGPIDPTLPEEVKKATVFLRQLISELPLEQSGEWYFNKIKMESEKQGYSWGKNGMKVPGAPKPGQGDGESDEGWVLMPSDEHGGWDDVPEEIRDIVEGKIKHALRKACEKADGQPNGWGNIPSELRQEIRAYAFGSVDWRKVLKNWTGMRQAGGRSRSIKRIDRKYPLVHPGIKRSRRPSILVAVDMSGSVDDGQLSRIYGALDGCSKHVSFDVLPFDYGPAEDAMFTWKRGSKPKLTRVRCGGTDFESVVRWVNDPKRRGKYDGVILATDGEAARPSASRVKLAWLITPGHKLMFEPFNGEMVITMSDRDDVGNGKL